MASEIDLIGGFYSENSLSWASQDTVNWIPEIAEVAGTRTKIKLATAPGLRSFALLSNERRPIRGLHNAEGRLFVVSGNDLCIVGRDGTSHVVGQIPGLGRVSISHNQITGGNEVLVVNGQSGGGYVYNTYTKEFKKIADEAYPGAKCVAYMDSYLLQVEPLGRFWFHSDLANASSYNTLDRYESEGAPDRIVTLATSESEVVIFNERTIEFFYNAGGTTGTFANKKILIDHGCSSANSVAKLDNSLFWLGDDGVVYRLNGYQAVPISTGPMQDAFRGLNWGQAFSFVWDDARHKIYYLTFPDGHTWGYDVVTQMWHRRESFNRNKWRLTHLIRWDGKFIGGDFQDGRLWELTADAADEGGEPLIRSRTAGFISNNQGRLVCDGVELLVNPGRGKLGLTPQKTRYFLYSDTYPIEEKNEIVISGKIIGVERRSLVQTAKSSDNNVMISGRVTGAVMKNILERTRIEDNHISISGKVLSATRKSILQKTSVSDNGVSISGKILGAERKKQLLRTSVADNGISIQGKILGAKRE